MEAKIQWAVMDTFDALAAAYDNPATMDDVKNGLRTADIRITKLKAAMV